MQLLYLHDIIYMQDIGEYNYEGQGYHLYDYLPDMTVNCQFIPADLDFKIFSGERPRFS